MRDFLIFVLIIAVIGFSIVLVDKYYYEIISFGNSDDFRTICYLENGDVEKGSFSDFNKNNLVIFKEGDRRVISSKEIKKIILIKRDKEENSSLSSGAEKASDSSNVDFSFSKETKNIVKEKYAVKKNGRIPVKIKNLPNSEKLNIENYLVDGYVVVFDFYADWCPPCRKLGPKLEVLVKKYDDVLLRKINIRNWSSPVCKKYNIRSIPYVIVYDKKGNQVGSPSYDFYMIRDNIRKARNSN